MTVDDAEYWAYTRAELGIYDAVSNVKTVKDETGKKPSWVGVSQGTAQMFYGLAHLEESFFADNLNTFAAVDPCVVLNNPGDDYLDALF